MKVYVITKTQGDYSEMRTTVFATFKGQWEAEKYKYKAHRVFWECYSYYSSCCASFKTWEEMTDEEADLYSLYVTKINNFYDCRFNVEEFELR